MKTIKIIDLLNKIANGETPKIKLGNEEYFYQHGDYRRTTDDEWLFANEIINLEELNDEVEILDEEDEFEDIKELDVNKFHDIDECVYRIDSLIKNQKKIIERLKDE